MTVWLVTGILLLSASIVLMYRPSVPSVLLAYAGLWTMRLSGLTTVSSETMLFWAIAVMIVLGIDFLKSQHVGQRSVVRRYIVTGTLAGMLLGLAVSPEIGGVAGSFAGAVVGAVAYRMTPVGKTTAEPIVAHLCRIGLPAVVTCSIIALVLKSVIAASPLTQ